MRKGIAVALAMIVSLSIPLSVKADNTDYGADAYQYMRYLNDVHPDRVQGTQEVREAGYWIMTTLQSFGYEVEVYSYNDFGIYTVNYVATKQGNSGQCVYVGSHYDCVAGETRGADDNASGVGVNLELAKRFIDVPTNDTIKFCFWDAEELEYAYLGSYEYIEHMSQEEKNNCLLYINLDCVAAGDSLYAYSGVYDDYGNLNQIWPLYMADNVAARTGVALYHMPSAVTYYDPPTRTGSSDNYYFYANGIPYLYFEANCWVRPDGSMNTEHQWLLTSSNEAFLNTNGQIMHTGNDNMDIIESAIPGTIQRNLTATSTVVSQILREVSAQSPTIYAAAVPVETSAAEETEEVTKTTEETEEVTKTTEETEESEETEETEDTETEEVTETTEETLETEESESEAAQTSEEVETTIAESENSSADIQPADVGDVSEKENRSTSLGALAAVLAVLAAVAGVSVVLFKKRK